MRIHLVSKTLLFGMAIGILAASQARADVYGRIRGLVTDPSGAVVAGATITVTDVATGVRQTVNTSAAGTYEALNLLAPATYTVTADASGFKRFQAHSIPLALNQIYVLNIQLEIGSTTQEVTVEAASSQVESTSIELGTTINSRAIVNLPLNGRNWVQLQQLQPGVVAASDARGVGDLVFSTNGSQPDQNSYLINGTDNNDFPLNTPQTTPSADAIAEFKMVTNTINPEYGRNSGAILNAVIKSGNNQFHGDGFDFYRDTSLNARNFFLPTPDTVHRNQFGGTIGGPIWKNHTFSFFSYQGLRQARPENSGDCGCDSPGVTPVFSSAQRTGLFPDVATSSTASPFPLVGESGATYPAGTPYSTIFPTGHIPTGDFNWVAAGLLSKYVPNPTAGNDFTYDAAFTQYDDQYLNRIDHTFSAKDALWVYWLWEREGDTDVIPFIGATVPGFGQKDGEHWQQYVAAWNHTFSGSMLNEARTGYTRLNYLSVVPQTPTPPSAAGFTSITPQLTTGEGIPFIDVVGYFDLGFSEAGPQPRLDQTYDVANNLTKIAGKHSFKLGFDMRRFEVYNPYAHINSGTFTFNGTGPYSTGDPGADFLLGVPYQYEQGSGDILNERAREYYSYFQDQWKVKANLTLTYGVGWSIDTPAVDNFHDNHAGIAFRAGQQSTVFPTAPEDYVFQGDPGVNAFGTTHYKHFGPRFGFAYSPDWGPLTGGAGKTSIRAGFGIYFDRFNGETALQTQGSPPFAISSYGVADAGGSPSFANPWTDVAGMVTIPNKFPYEPSSTPNFSIYEPLSVSVYDPKISVPAVQNFNLTIQRQLSDSTIFSLGYVGSIGRHEILTSEINPGINPAGCAAIPACAASDDLPTLFPGNYAYPGNIFGSVGQVETVGISNYNSVQTSMERHFSHGLQFLVAYVYSKSMDDSSGFENSGFQGSGFGGFGETRSVNPFNRRVADYGPSIFDAQQRMVISYVYALPSLRHFNSLHILPSRLTDGWQITGITTFQSGFPLDVVDGALQSLTVSPYDFYDGPPSFSGWDVPNRVGKTAYVNPRLSVGGSNYWFSPQNSGFAAPALGTEGNASRNLLRGPGLNNFDFGIMKDITIMESVKIELRFEFFNFFNHTQFDPNGITTDFNSHAFGTETAAHDPRLIQLAGKFYF